VSNAKKTFSVVANGLTELAKEQAYQQLSADVADSVSSTSGEMSPSSRSGSTENSHSTQLNKKGFFFFRSYLWMRFGSRRYFICKKVQSLKFFFLQYRLSNIVRRMSGNYHCV
jgi:hypothetical protein